MKKAKKKTPKKRTIPVLPEDSGFEKAKTESILIFGDLPNPLWKKGITDGGRGTGCNVAIPKRYTDKLRNKVVKCELVDENGEIYYKYVP